MTPARSSTRRTQPEQNIPVRQPLQEQGNENIVNDELFIDPMLGSPLAMYIEKDVKDKDTLVDLITVSRVAYIRM